MTEKLTMAMDMLVLTMICCGMAIIVAMTIAMIYTLIKDVKND